jgi:hypothetical protein
MRCKGTTIIKKSQKEFKRKISFSFALEKKRHINIKSRDINKKSRHLF